MIEIIQAMAPLGVGGALAGVIFYFHIQQDKQWREGYEMLAGEFRTIVQENTKAIQANTDTIHELIKSRNGGNQ